MQIEDSVAIVTGANRGLGREFARALLDAGAAKVYAGARDPSAITDSGVVPIALDVTDRDQVAAAARQASDVTIVVNNAGIDTGADILDPSALRAIQDEFEVNYYGPLAMSQAFAPVLAANGGGALVNMLSVLSWLAGPPHLSYSTTKSAAWSLTNALRVRLRAQGTLVVGVHAGYLDTDMAAAVAGPKTPPALVAAQVVDALAQGREEVLADQLSRDVKANLARDLELLYPGVQERYDAAVGAAA